MAVRQVDEVLLAELRERVAASARGWRPGAEVAGLRPLTGGTSSLTFVVDVAEAGRDDASLVLKVAPPGLAPVRNRDVLRQARLQKAVQGRSRSLAPDVLFADAGAPPEVPPFMAMNLVPGECLEPVLLPEEQRPAPATVRARYLDAAGVLADLHRIDPRDVGLADEPVVGLAAEIDRWTRAFATLPEELSGDYLACAQALHATMPEPLHPVVNHGDFRLGNTLCEGDRLNTVIDWEIWSVGDPRVDVTWMEYFTDGSGHPAIAPGAPAGTPSGPELVGVYEAAIGRSLPDLDWFRALTRYKEAGLTGLLLKRADKDGRRVTDALGRMRPALPALLKETLDLVGR
ncbi:aminoglycoside phosphotransferase (APT) family kinase protein [Actinocorallia herbida]|uniref:Aminoglycoside phosphotransferase (APT) family kinase protein n=1 Tax=Actinocorallia herbida TaxID=58109 RepID=A0A3N1D311_9ACTN|nr:phosphotransferase family protein [Actinocorallia herbida]ROO87448.1 aminoglycoside phosphotransferase (APT) family kinase protein [Actinocorallia herbida]